MPRSRPIQGGGQNVFCRDNHNYQSSIRVQGHRIKPPPGLTRAQRAAKHMHSKVRIKHIHARTRIYLRELIYHTLPLMAFYLEGVKLHPGELTRFRHNSFQQQIRSHRNGNCAPRRPLLSRLHRLFQKLSGCCMCLYMYAWACVYVCTRTCARGTMRHQLIQNDSVEVQKQAVTPLKRVFFLIIFIFTS